MLAKLLASAALLVGSVLAQNRIIDLAKADAKFSTLVSLVSKFPDLVSAVSGNGPLTLFAPTNEAFATLQTNNPDLYKNLTTNDALLKDTLLRHVVLSKAEYAGVPNELFFFEAGNTETLTITIVGPNPQGIGATVNSVPILGKVAASNGLIYPVQDVVPSNSLSKSVSNFFKTIPTITGANGLVSKIDFYSVLDTLQDATILIPIDPAIDQLNQFIKDNNITVTPALVSAILDQHIIQGARTPTNFGKTPRVSGFYGDEVKYVDLGMNGSFVQGAGNAAPVRFAFTPAALFKLVIAYPLNGVLLPDLSKVTRGEGKDGINLPTFHPRSLPPPPQTTDKPYPTYKPYPTQPPATDCSFPTPTPKHDYPYPNDYPHETPAATPTPTETPYPTSGSYSTGEDKPVYNGASGMVSVGAAFAAAVAAVQVLAL
nr:hypothetical protein HK105_007945 [Polyrhizophydium stewartii]